jgi:hypothetical protein
MVREIAGSAISLEVSGQSPVGFPVSLELVSVVGYDDETKTPTNPPSLTGTNPAQFDWQTAPADIGIWLATFRACDSSGGCITRDIEMQLVESNGYLVDFEPAETPDPPHAQSMSHGNFDSDAHSEILVTGDGLYYTPTLEVFDYDVVSHFQEVFSIEDVNKRAAQVGFFNEDSFLDAVVVDFDNGDRISVFQGNGDNTFSPIDSTGIPSTARGSVLGEFTGDKYIDFATVWYEGVRVHAGGSGPLFQPAFLVSTVNTALSVNSADFNDDGYDDLAVGTEAGLDIYLNDGAGGFALANSYSQEYSSVDIEVTNEGTDFNNDNIFDLCLATPSLGGTYSEIIVPGQQRWFFPAIAGQVGQGTRACQPIR